MQTAGGRVKSEMRLFFCKGRRQRGLGVILRPRLCRARRDILHRRQQRACSLLCDALKQLAGGLVLANFHRGDPQDIACVQALI